MKKMLLSIPLIFLFYAGNCQNRINCTWQKSNIIPDGHNTEWGAVLPYYNSESMVGYSITNDSNYMYLVFEVTNKIMERKIMAGGMQLRIKTKNNRKNPALISFPLPFKKGDANVQQPPEEEQKPGEHRRPGFTKYRERFISTNINFTSSGFISENGQFTLPKTQGIVVALNWDSSSMYYEVKIPLKEIFGLNYQLAEISKKNFLVFLEIPAAQMPTRPQNQDGDHPQRGGRPQMGENNSSGGEFPENGHGPRHEQGNMQSDERFEIMFNTQTLKVKVRLAAINIIQH